MSTIVSFVISFLALLWAANHLVTGATGIANYFRLSPFIIGLTVVALGTAAPEIVLILSAVLKDKNNIALGNALGSNIANIGLILGIIMLAKPTFLNSNILKKAYPILIIAMLFVYSSILDGFLGKIDGCLFLIAVLLLIGFFIHLSHENPIANHLNKESKAKIISTRSLKFDVFSIVVGLSIIPVGAKYLLLSCIDLALWSGMSELSIGLTIMAIGTSLPELVTALTAVMKNEEGLALGTILGSNIYNLLLVLAFPALLNPAHLNTIIIRRDMPVLILLSLLLLFLNYHYKEKITRCHGGILLLVYCSYIISIVIKAI